MKRILSIFLALCMVVTLLPMTAMAEETPMPIGTNGEIISFAPLTETEKMITTGTSIEDLELPKTLTATVRTAVSIGEDSVQDSGSTETATPTTATEPEWEEGTVEISVEWDSTPEYDMGAEGVYVFTPVIEGYTVSAPLPEITVTTDEMLAIAPNSDRATTYGADKTVPNTVTGPGLTAQLMSSTITEQFNLTPGGTYYFDLSSEKDNIGTVNTALPDASLHYVPFTYAGTVNAYSLDSASSGNTGSSAAAIATDRSLFVGDYAIGNSISWDSLNTANLIFGKTFDTNYTLRSLSGGSSKIGSAPDGHNHVGQPNTNEWDQILDKSGSTDNTTGWIKNCNNSIFHWTQDTFQLGEMGRVERGGISARFFAGTNSDDTVVGFRPALEVLNPVTLGHDGLKAVTLNLNGGKLKENTADINIICAGDSFTAPSGDGLTAPDGTTFDGWKDTSSATTYTAGADVPKAVTGLTAQWANALGAAITTPATFASASHNQITVNAAVASSNPGGQAIEYAISTDGSTAPDSGWQAGLTFISLSPNTNYYVWARTAAKTGFDAGTAMASAVITTTAAPASISSTTATFDLNPTTANNTLISVTLTSEAYALTTVRNGETSLTQNTDYDVDEGQYTFLYEYLNTLPVGTTTITFDMNGGTDPTLSITVEDTRTSLSSVSVSDTTPTFGDTLSATIDPGATVSYSWQADGSQVGTGATYEVKAADIGKTITLTVTGTQGYKGTATSTATSAVAAKDYSVTVDSTKSVAQGSGLSTLPTADAGGVSGMLTWYSNSVRTTTAVDTDISALSVSDSVMLYWSFTATTAGYVTTPKTGSCVVTIVSGMSQILSFAESTVTKTLGDPVFTNTLTHSVGTGAVTYSSSNANVATVHSTSGAVSIVGAGTTTITANAAMVPGAYAPGSTSFTLTVNNAPIKTVSVGSQNGTATAGTTGSLTYTVTTANIANGIYAVSVANLPAGITVGNSGNVTVSGNSGTLTLTVADTATAGTTDTLALTLDGTTSTAFRIAINASIINYTVTFNPNGGTISETSRSVASGAEVGALPTPTRSGSYRFDGWYTAASGGTKISASTTVSANVTHYAHWTYTGGGGSGSGGGSSSNHNSSPVIVIPPTPDKPNSPTQGEIKVLGTVDSKGNVTVNITDKNVNDAFDKALADAKKNGNEQNGITVVLRVDTGNKSGSNVTVNLPKAVQDTIIAKKIVNTIVVVDNPDIRIGMDLATIKEINKQAKSDVNITATREDNGKLTGNAKKAIGSRPVFVLKVNYGNGKTVSSFGAGSVSVTIPYTLGADEKAGYVQAVYVDAKGKVHWLTNSVYDSVENVLHFSTNHFSTYGIGYQQVNRAFTDITDHWAKEDIEFLVSRGVFRGTSNTTFSPNTAMTRGMFVTVLGRLANADVSDYVKSSFSDVKNDAYYMGYIEWASKNNIVNGVGNGKFAPNQSITREQMAVIMSNYTKTIGYTLPKVHIETIFADNANISTSAKEAVKQMQMAGVISGKNSNLFDPQGTVTRAEVSVVLRRFVELTISSDTAQGWSTNDSGKWMYFKDGKPLTGKQDIDGVTYTFDQYGVTADVPKNLRYTTYTVKKGDSFLSISRKLGCSISELERLNNKNQFSLILPGNVLRVPEK